MTNRVLVGFAAALLLPGLAACGADATGRDASPAAGDTTLTVFAAASLKQTFTELGKRFEAAHPGTDVTFNFAGSSDLVAQLEEGAPADVFASADTATMARATAADLVSGQPVDFATNTLQIAVPPGNPAGITTLADLAEPGVKVVLCAPQVPCGSAAAGVEAAAKVDLTPVSEETSVADVLGKVSSGEADAGLVYVTDVKAAGDEVEGIAFPESSSAVNTYPVAALSGTRTASLAAAFVALVTSAEGREVLADAGFGAP